MSDFHGVQTYTVPAATTFDTITRLENKLYYEVGVNYARTFGGHEVTALALFNRTKTTTSAGSVLAFPSYREDWVGRVTYNWRERYLFEGNISYTGILLAPQTTAAWSGATYTVEYPLASKEANNVLTPISVSFANPAVSGASTLYIRLISCDMLRGDETGDLAGPENGGGSRIGGGITVTHRTK